MRTAIAASFLLAFTMAAAAQTGAGPGSAGPLQTYAVPGDGPKTVYILKRIMKPGESVGLHTHPGVEITQVISGDFQLTIEGHSRLYHAGDSFIVPRGARHDGKNVAVTYVLDKGVPLRTSLP